MKPLDPMYVDHIWMVGLGAYGPLYLDKPSPLLSMFNKQLKNFAFCPYCNKRIALTKRNAAAFFIREQLNCGLCKQVHHFPLQWLLRLVKARVSKKPRVQT